MREGSHEETPHEGRGRLGEYCSGGETVEAPSLYSILPQRILLRQK
jgi:hypothetical protein